MPSLKVIFPLIAALTLSTGCPGPKAYQLGYEYQLNEEMYEAAKQYLTALDHRPNSAKYHASLRLVAEAAYKEVLRNGHRARKEADFPRAREIYMEVKAYTKHLQRHDSLFFDIDDIDSHIEKMSIAAATERYESGKTAMANGKLEAAITDFKKALEFKPGFKDAAELIAECHYGVAEGRLEKSKYRQAAQHFAAAHRSLKGGYKDANERSANLYYSIGKQRLSTGHCQAAFGDFQSAKGLLSSPKLDEAAAAAHECGRRDVAVVAQKESIRPNAIGSDALIALEEGLLTACIDYAKSREFLTAGPLSIASDEASSPAAISALLSRTAATYERLVIPSIDTIEKTQSPWEPMEHSTNGKLWDRCADGTELCASDVVVTYTVYKGVVTLALTSSISAYSTADGTLDWSHSDTTSMDSPLKYADDFKVDGVAVTIGTEKALGVAVVDRPVQTLANGGREVDQSSMMQAIIDDVIMKSADEMMKRASEEEAPPALSELVIEPAQ
jgi:tetratricopeptide (TPR) repeat protein